MLLYIMIVSPTTPDSFVIFLSIGNFKIFLAVIRIYHTLDEHKIVIYMIIYVRAYCMQQAGQYFDSYAFLSIVPIDKSGALENNFRTASFPTHISSDRSEDSTSP